MLRKLFTLNVSELKPIKLCLCQVSLNQFSHSKVRVIGLNSSTVNAIKFSLSLVKVTWFSLIKSSFFRFIFYISAFFQLIVCRSSRFMLNLFVAIRSKTNRCKVN